jgi:hypothetical protein
MSIKRVELPFEGQFTQVPNAWVRDERLSRKARGLLVEMMSHRVGWRITIQGLVKAGREGRDAIDTAVGELVSLGYLVRSQGRAEGGVFAEVEYEIADPGTASGLSVSGSTASGLSASGKSATKKTIDKEHHSEEHHQRAFDEFWAVYPRHVARAAALKSFLGQARKVGPDVIVAGAKRFAADPNLPEKQFVPHPTTWLNQGRWEDEALPGPGGSSAVVSPMVSAETQVWLSKLGIPVEEYLERRNEPGWVESMRRRAHG